jgi:hypothetical protein
MGILKRYADSLEPHQRHILTDVHEYIKSRKWQEEYLRLQKDTHNFDGSCKLFPCLERFCL